MAIFENDSNREAAQKERDAAEKAFFLEDVKNGVMFNETTLQSDENELTSDLIFELINHNLSADELKLVLNKYGDFMFQSELKKNPDFILEQMKKNPNVSKEKLTEERIHFLQYGLLSNVLHEQGFLLRNYVPYKKIVPRPVNPWAKELVEYLSGEYVYLSEQIHSTDMRDEILDEKIKKQKVFIDEVKRFVAEKNLESFYGGLTFETVCGGETRIDDYTNLLSKHRKNFGKPLSTLHKEAELAFLRRENAFYELVVQGAKANKDFNVWELDPKETRNINFKGAFEKYKLEQNELQFANEMIAPAKQKIPPEM